VSLIKKTDLWYIIIIISGYIAMGKS